MTLFKSIKDNLREEDQNVLIYIDFEKSDEDIITAMINAKLLKFDSNKYDDQENR